MVPFALETVHDTDVEDANDVTTAAAAAAAAWQLASASTTAAVTARFMLKDGGGQSASELLLVDRRSLCQMPIFKSITLAFAQQPGKAACSTH
jgi:hypothetical protein